MAIEETDYAWAAGIIDGEGYLGLNRRVRGNRLIFTPRITVTNTDPKMLLRLRELFGGGIYSYSNKGKFGRKPQWVWVAYQLVALSMLEKVIPYMISRRADAETLSSFRYLRRQRGGKMNGHGMDDPILRAKNAALLEKQKEMFMALKRRPEKELS